ncbi:MAG TPA: hypothetical protein VER14_04705 [Phototrophicaceae bacterium]|nr:hypothetical protein [Phototrophicaceae bacterium]
MGKNPKNNRQITELTDNSILDNKADILEAAFATVSIAVINDTNNVH